MNGMETSVDFNFSFAPGVTQEQIIGFELAGEMWAQHLGDTHMKVDEGKDFTVNIHVEITDDLLPNNVLGGAFPAIETGEKYKDFYEAIVDDVSNDKDEKAVDSLLDRDKVDILVGDRVVSNDHMQMTRANLKALNIIKADDKKLDGYIVINDLSNVNSIEWNYDYLGGAKAGTLDFLSTATHEIGHVMGFISGTDRSKLPTQFLREYTRSSSNNIIKQAKFIRDTGGYFVQFDNGTEATETQHNNGNWVEFKGKYQQKDLQEVIDAIENLDNLEDYNSKDQAEEALKTIKEFLEEDKYLEKLLKKDKDFEDVLDKLANVEDSKSYAQYMTSMDLFRYSVDSANSGINDLSVGNAAYFSLDGSQTGLALSKGTSYDYQGSHWQDRELGNGLGVMNPTIARGERWEISQNDLSVMDAIGWDVDWDVINSGAINLESLYEIAESQAIDATIKNRDKDVKKVINSEAYKWTSRASYSGWWQAKGLWQKEGYFSTYNYEITPNTGEGSTPSSNETGEFQSLIIEILSNQSWKDNLSDYGQSHDRVDNFSAREDSATSSNETEKYKSLIIEIINDFPSYNPENSSNQDDLSGNLDSYINQWLKDNISDYWQSKVS